MVGQSSAMFGWSWTEVSVLGSQVFGQALMESCEGLGVRALEIQEENNRLISGLITTLSEEQPGYTGSVKQIICVCLLGNWQTGERIEGSVLVVLSGLKQMWPLMRSIHCILMSIISSGSVSWERNHSPGRKNSEMLGRQLFL